MNVRLHLLFLTGSLKIFGACDGQSKQELQEATVVAPTAEPKQAEIFYHVVQRSFYDSNGDLHGDLKGLEEKLDYLQELGITSILLLPLYKSDYYHNYFPDDFEKIDSEFGSHEEYLSLVKAVHARGMKIFMDMEIHYATEKHLWYSDSYQNPASRYSDYIRYNGPGNTEPESIIFGLNALESYSGEVIRIATLNLNNDNVRSYINDLFAYWVDPNKDGDFTDGVDGYRIDHMMDDLDGKGIFTDMFQGFWRPLFQNLRRINPQVRIMGEQAEWKNLGEDYFTKSDLDMVFAFTIREAILGFDKSEVIESVSATYAITPPDKDQIVFVENHDTDRFATLVNQNPGKMKVGAALNLLLKGVPSIYYGQEIGMLGDGGFEKFNSSDANDIPRREAFEWYRSVDGPGMALWYRDTGPWWDQTNLKDNDGISFEEQINDDQSLLSYYKKLIALRKGHGAIANGEIEFVDNDNGVVLSFLRRSGQVKVLVVINLSETRQAVKVNQNQLAVASSNRLFTDLLTGQEMNKDFQYELDAYDVLVISL